MPAGNYNFVSICTKSLAIGVRNTTCKNWKTEVYLHSPTRGGFQGNRVRVIENFSGKAIQENSYFGIARAFHGKIQVSLKGFVPIKGRRCKISLESEYTDIQILGGEGGRGGQWFRFHLMLAPGMILSAPHIGKCVLKSSLCSMTTCNCVSRENPDFEFPTAGRATEKNYMPDLSVYCFLSSITFLTSSRATLSAYTCQTRDSNSSVLKNQSDVFFIFTADQQPLKKKKILLLSWSNTHQGRGEKQTKTDVALTKLRGTLLPALVSLLLETQMKDQRRLVKQQ